MGPGGKEAGQEEVKEGGDFVEGQMCPDNPPPRLPAPRVFVGAEVWEGGGSADGMKL